MLLTRNRYMWKLSLLFRKYKRFIIFTSLLFIITNIILYAFDQPPKFQYDEIYQGTFRGKYLETIKHLDELKTNDFYTKWTLVGYLDDLVNEPIQNPTFQNSVDPFELLDQFEDKFGDNVKFNNFPFLDRIKFYTNEILPKTNFTFHAIQDTIYKDAYYSKKFISTRLKKWLKIKENLTEQEQKQLGIDDDWFKNIVAELRQAKINHNLISANEIKNSLTQLKFFSNFFLKPEKDDLILHSEDSDKYLSECSLFSKFLFDDWLTGELPTFTHYDKLLHEKKINPYTNKVDGCFVKMLQSNFKGRGIVFTTDDDLVPELAGILAILRITGNTLPIQIFYNKDLSLESIRTINDIATAPIMKLPTSLTQNKLKIPRNPPTLDITFVDVSNTISFKYKKFFHGFGMKLLAYLFNTFEEMVMLDTDTVILGPIDSFFKSPKYTSTNAYFFRDRNANSFLYEGIVEYFKSYLNYDHEVHYLGLPKVKEETLNNRFFGSMARHYMESGLFLINRKEKFDGVLASVILQMFKLFSGSLHGEKEFIWLGQEIMGESYTFNENAAIAVGELSPDKGLKSHELCSTHPAHIDDDKATLLWFNSGFLTCKKPQSYYKDINFERNEEKSLLELKREYLSPLHITHGLMPPPAEYTMDLKNGEPTRGWAMTSECSNYLWCSYDIIAGGTNPKIPTGEVITFNPEDTKTWDYLGRLWVNYFNIGAHIGGSDSGYIEGDAYDELGLDDIDVFKNKPDGLDETDLDLLLMDEKYKDDKYDDVELSGFDLDLDLDTHADIDDVELDDETSEKKSGILKDSSGDIVGSIGSKSKDIIDDVDDELGTVKRL